MAFDGCKYCKRHASMVDDTSSEKNECPYIIDEVSGQMCGKERRVVASDGRKYCQRHASMVDGTSYEKDECPYIIDEVSMQICGEPRYTVASDGCKYCKRHASIIDGKSFVCPYITDESSENKCGERAAVVANDGIRYCRLHAGIIDKICLEPGCGSRPGIEKWCGGYCKDHARMQGMIEKNMCLEPGCESWRVFTEWSHGYCGVHAPAHGYKDPNTCRQPNCRQPSRRETWCKGYCKFHAKSSGHEPQPRHTASFKSARVPIDTYQDENFPSSHTGEMDQQCRYCYALHFKGELIRSGKPHYNICCQNGKLRDIEQIPAPHKALEDLLIGYSARSRHFREHVREYNAALSFVSLGCNIDTPPGHGPPVFRIHGAMYHNSMAMDIETGTKGAAKYAQLYLYDHKEALMQRMARNPRLRKDILDELQTMLEETSPFPASYRFMKEIPQTALALGVLTSDVSN